MTRLFWQHGYATTSVQDVVAAVGLHRASLYGAFGTKRDLLLRALDRYRETAETTLRAVADARPVLPALEEFLMVPLRPRADPLGWGCLLGNTSAELDEDDADLRRALARGWTTLETGLGRVLQSAQDAGEIAVGDLEARVHMLVAVQRGLHVIARTDPHPQRLAAAVSSTVQALGSCRPRRPG